MTILRRIRTTDEGNGLGHLGFHGGSLRPPTATRFPGFPAVLPGSPAGERQPVASLRLGHRVTHG
jgi:hypothetical protein